MSYGLAITLWGCALVGWAYVLGFVLGYQAPAIALGVTGIIFVALGVTRE